MSKVQFIRCIALTLGQQHRITARYCAQTDNHQWQVWLCIVLLGGRVHFVHCRVARIERLVLDTYQFHSEDIVLVVGQDGLVANTIKYLSGQPVLGVNPDAQRWDGQLLGFNASNIEEGIRQLLQGKSKISAISLAEARSNDGQRMLAVNDLFIGPKTHSSARYQLSWQQQAEVQSSSGIIVSTGLGRTGWLQSILTGAAHTMNPGNT